MEPSDFTSLAWSDLELEGFAWVADGRDLSVHLLLPRQHPANQTRRVVTFRWAEGVTVALAFSEGRGGRPLTWRASFEPLSDGRAFVLLDFAEAGEIRLNCAEVDVATVLLDS